MDQEAKTLCNQLMDACGPSLYRTNAFRVAGLPVIAGPRQIKRRIDDLLDAEEMGDAMEDGIWFDGSSVEGFARIQESDMRLVIDADTYAILPWSPVELRRARVFCDIYQPDGTPFPGDPRGTLKRILEKINCLLNCPVI